MKYWLSLLMIPETDQLIELAQIAEEVGFHGVSVADHLVMPARFETPYPCIGSRLRIVSMSKSRVP